VRALYVRISPLQLQCASTPHARRFWARFSCSGHNSTWIHDCITGILSVWSLEIHTQVPRPKRSLQMHRRAFCPTESLGDGWWQPSWLMTFLSEKKRLSDDFMPWSSILCICVTYLFCYYFFLFSDYGLGWFHHLCMNGGDRQGILGTSLVCTIWKEKIIITKHMNGVTWHVESCIIGKT
jgi:hypothetical protein